MIEPCLREKKRYVIIETDNETTYEEIKSKIYKETLAFLGEKGTGELGLVFLKEQWHKNIGYLRVSHKKVNEIKLILGLIETKTIKTAGSLKKTKEVIKKHASTTN